MEINIEKELVEEFASSLRVEEIKMIKSPTLNFGADQLLEFLTVGGGIAAISKCILEYLKLHYQKRKVHIKIDDSRTIEVEGQSKKEIEELLAVAQKIIVTKTSNDETEANNR